MGLVRLRRDRFGAFMGDWFQLDARFWPLCRHLSRDRTQATHAQQVVSGRGEIGLTLIFRHALDARLAQAAHGLLPTKDLLDELALTLRDLIAVMASSASVYPSSGPRSVKRHMRDDAPLTQPGNEALLVIALIAAYGGRAQPFAPLPLQHRTRGIGFLSSGSGKDHIHAQAVAIFHKYVLAVAELGFLAKAFAHELSLRISARLMGGIAALLAFEIDHAISSWIIIAAIFAPKALERGPRFDQRAVHGEVLVGQQLLALRALDHAVKKAACHIMLNQALAQAAKVRLIQRRLCQIHVQEPSKQDV